MGIIGGEVAGGVDAGLAGWDSDVHGAVEVGVDFGGDVERDGWDGDVERDGWDGDVDILVLGDLRDGDMV